MDGKRYYPIFLDLEGKPVVVVGGGKVGLRKAKGLVEAGARVTVVAPHQDAEFDALPVERIGREYRGADLDGMELAFAATDERRVNHQIAEDAKHRGIPVNVADDPGECDFIVPARIARGAVQVAVSTGGTDPARAARLRAKIAESLESEISA
jgi:siroheme synthase-like protein